VNQVIVALSALEPKEIPALALLEQLTTAPVFVDELAGLALELEQAGDEMNRISDESKGSYSNVWNYQRSRRRKYRPDSKTGRCFAALPAGQTIQDHGRAGAVPAQGPGRGPDPPALPGAPGRCSVDDDWLSTARVLLAGVEEAGWFEVDWATLDDLYQFARRPA